jgi:hypothetical protein
MNEQNHTPEVAEEVKFCAADVLKLGLAVGAVIGLGWLAYRCMSGGGSAVPMLPTE